MGAVKSMCQWVILMDHGEVVEQGSSEKVADEYLKRVHARGNQRLSELNRATNQYPRWGTGEIETLAIELTGEEGRATHVFRPGEPFRVRVAFRAVRSTPQPVFGLGIFRSDGTYINGSNHLWREQPIHLRDLSAGEEGSVEMQFDALPLLQGQYYLTIYVYDHAKAAPTAIDHREHAAIFEVVDARQRQHGILSLPMQWSVHRQLPGNPEPSIERSLS
jgi:hypothetical protein